MHHTKAPSWVSDWGQQPESSLWKWDTWVWDMIRLKRYPHYAANKTKASAQRLEESMLKIEGGRFSTITEVGTLVSCKIWQEDRLLCKKVMLWMKEINRDNLKAYKNVRIWEDAYWRILCGDVWQLFKTGGEAAHRKTQTEDRRVYELWKEAVLDERQCIPILPTANVSSFSILPCLRHWSDLE